MSEIRELADAHSIDVTAYGEAWQKLCEAAWDVVEVAESRLEALEW